MKPKAIFIVAGHGWSNGGKDDGARGNGTTERKEVEEIAKELIERLRADPQITAQIIAVGVFERMNVTAKVGTVNGLCQKNGWKRDDTVLVDIHLNSAGAADARGVEAWVDIQGGGEPLGKAIVDAVADATKLPIRKYPVQDTSANRHGRLGIIDDTIPVAALIECGFVTNELDAKALKDSQFDDKFAQGIHEGIRDFLGLPSVIVPPAWYTDVPDDAFYADDLRLCVREGLYVIPASGRFNPTPDSTRQVTVMARHLRIHHDAQ